ncbi:hypothetical protein [Dyella flagellata]|nr:hypothetical protein [Dyella flagellata]
MLVQGRFQRTPFACGAAHDHGKQDTMAVIRQALSHEREAASYDGSSDIDKQTLSCKRERLYFQIDH